MAAKPTVITVKRSARKGRPISPSTVAAHAALSKAWGAKTNRATVNVVDPTGKVIDTYAALVVTAKDVGKPATFTGMVGLISQWAKANGHAIRTSKVSDTQYAIRSKG